MDIEVAEQLFPNILTIVTQLCATGVLLFFAVKFLWTPGREMLAKRQELMQSRLTDAEKLKEAAAEEKAHADMELRAMQNRVKDMIENAKDEANTEKERILEEANRQAEATLERANATIEKQKEEMRRDLQKEIVDVALAASTKLMGRDELEEQDARALESFVKEISDESDR
ncbi:MAG: F0F1 ATP synthase subunit B [Atopobiaceae bacterium]|nr:F0F1 ATP synthase subunit B [Atopobiaceae bacterium]